MAKVLHKNFNWHQQDSHIPFGSICGAYFNSSTGKGGYCFAYHSDYGVDSFIFLKGIWTYGVSLYGMAEKIVYMFSICLFFLLVEHWRPIKWIRIFFSWFGKYSLELYVLHLLIFCFVSSKMVLADIDPIVKVVIMLLGALAL